MYKVNVTIKPEEADYYFKVDDTEDKSGMHLVGMYVEENVRHIIMENQDGGGANPFKFGPYHRDPNETSIQVLIKNPSGEDVGEGSAEYQEPLAGEMEEN